MHRLRDGDVAAGFAAASKPMSEVVGYVVRSSVLSPKSEQGGRGALLGGARPAPFRGSARPGTDMRARDPLIGFQRW
jgi:hypothetical protein